MHPIFENLDFSVKGLVKLSTKIKEKSDAYDKYIRDIPHPVAQQISWRIITQSHERSYQLHENLFGGYDLRKKLSAMITWTLLLLISIVTLWFIALMLTWNTLFDAYDIGEFYMIQWIAITKAELPIWLMASLFITPALLYRVIREFAIAPKVFDTLRQELRIGKELPIAYRSISAIQVLYKGSGKHTYWEVNLVLEDARRIHLATSQNKKELKDIVTTLSWLLSIPIWEPTQEF